MGEELKLEDAELNKEVADTEAQEQTSRKAEVTDDNEEDDKPTQAPDEPHAASEKKKKSKKAKLKKAPGSTHSEKASNAAGPSSKMTNEMVEQLLQNNPSIKGEVAGLGKEEAAEKLKHLDLSSLLTGMSVGGKNQKDMASYRFWQTQPVPHFDDASQIEEGPIKIIDPEKVAKEPRAMYEGFEWVTMDLTQEKQLEEVYELLTGHYVEDDDAQFRFNYSGSFLSWALKAPGWRADWHIGVRASKSQKLVAFISGVPMKLRVRSKILNSSEINFLCVHKKLRSKRLAPVLIQEITRRCYALGIYQAIYTGGIVLPTPVSSCRYYHRSLDWLKLYEVGFSPLPSNSTKARQITKFHLPSSTSTPGLRPMVLKDVPEVTDLLNAFSNRFQMAPIFDREEIVHWLLRDDKLPEQVVWSYVVEDSTSHKITDFFSFYCLESQVIGNQKHDNVRAAYLFYYASQTAFEKDEKGLKERLNMLINDALILAKRCNFDVFNALTLLDNPLFLEQQKFGAGDGQLHYYLYNYRTAPIAGGVDPKNVVDPTKRGGVGVVML